MFRSAKNVTFISSIATILCACGGLNASAGIPNFSKSVGASIPTSSNYRPLADNSNSTQYNPYAQDEENNLNQYPDTQIYYDGTDAAGYGAAAAVGAGLNEARNEREAAELAGRRNRAAAERTGQATHQGFGGAEHRAEGLGGEHRGAERRGGEEHGHMGGGHMGGHGGRR